MNGAGGTKEVSRTMITFARKGRWEGDAGMKQLLSEAVKMHIDLDYNERPFYRSALWEATWRNHEVIVKALVEKGAAIDFKDYQDRTPLHEAAYYGHLNLVEYFVEKGAPINVIDKFGQTPLFRAVDGGRHDVVRYLVEKKAETNWIDNDQCTVQHCAAFQGFPSMSTWLLYKGSWRNRFAIEGAEEELFGKVRTRKILFGDLLERVDKHLEQFDVETLSERIHHQPSMSTPVASVRLAAMSPSSGFMGGVASVSLSALDMNEALPDEAGEGSNSMDTMMCAPSDVAEMIEVKM